MKEGKDIYSDKKFRMKTVIITGANGNLGSAVTKNFLSKGYRVIVTVATDQEKKAFGSPDHLDVQIVDLMQEEGSYSFIQSMIKKYGNIDAALLLVGGFAAGNIASTSGADLHKQFSLNFETAYFVTRPLFQHMLETNNGKIVYIGARPALVPEMGYGLLAYSLSKSLLFKLAEFLNAEAKGRNVSITVVAPSTLDTALNRKSMPDADPENWVKPEQLAEILEFMVSEKGNPLRETVLKVYNNG
jgi:NAD(P)-dependent dehydrogenase (short-subunit alcohol dehydrogenase family)